MSDLVKFCLNTSNENDDSVIKYKIKETERELKLVNRDIKGDIVKSAISLGVTIVGGFGTIYCGKNLIDLYLSNEAITFKTKFACKRDVYKKRIQLPQ